MIKVKLSDEEEAYAEQIGALRNQAFEDMNCGMDPLKRNGGKQGHILGFKCEIAASKALDTEAKENVFTKEDWYNKCQIFDLTNNVEIRGTEYFTGRLIVKPEDKDKAPFVLVIRNPASNEYLVRGWMYGFEAKQDKFLLTTKNGASLFFVPQGNLRPISELKQKIQEGSL
jgi:hypothetical protein